MARHQPLPARALTPRGASWTTEPVNAISSAADREHGGPARCLDSGLGSRCSRLPSGQQWRGEHDAGRPAQQPFRTDYLDLVRSRSIRGACLGVSHCAPVRRGCCTGPPMSSTVGKVKRAAGRAQAKRLVSDLKTSKQSVAGSLTLAELLHLPSLDPSLNPLAPKPLPEGYVVGSQGIYRVTSPLHRRIVRSDEERPDMGMVERNVSEKQRQETIDRRLQTANEIASEKFRSARRVAASNWSVAGREQARVLAVGGAPRTPAKVVRDELSRATLPGNSSRSPTLDSEGRVVADSRSSSLGRASPTRRRRHSPGRRAGQGRRMNDHTVRVDVGPALAVSVPDRSGKRSPTRLAPLHSEIEYPPRWWGQSNAGARSPVREMLLSPPGAPHISAHNSGLLAAIIDSSEVNA